MLAVLSDLCKSSTLLNSSQDHGYSSAYNILRYFSTAHLETFQIPRANHFPKALPCRLGSPNKPSPSLVYISNTLARQLKGWVPPPFLVRLFGSGWELQQQQQNHPGESAGRQLFTTWKQEKEGRRLETRLSLQGTLLWLPQT